MNGVKLANIEIAEHCYLDIQKKYIEFIPGFGNTRGFSGLYYRHEDLFFALLKTKQGPTMYYREALYLVKPELHIELVCEENSRVFRVQEYSISISYPTSKYIDFDIWSTEDDVDLFAQIFHGYQTEDFYKRYTET